MISETATTANSSNAAVVVGERTIVIISCYLVERGDRRIAIVAVAVLLMMRWRGASCDVVEDLGSVGRPTFFHTLLFHVAVRLPNMVHQYYHTIPFETATLCAETNRLPAYFTADTLAKTTSLIVAS